MNFEFTELPDCEPVFPTTAHNDDVNPLAPSSQRVRGKPNPGDFISSFAEKAIALLDQIEYRPITSSDDLEALFRFRYDCYYRDGHVLPRPDRKLIDHFDYDPQALRFAIWLDGEMVSAIRLQRMTPERRIGVSMLTFADILNPMLDAGCSFIDPSRLITDRRAAREHPQLAYLTVRLAAMAALHFNADYLLSTIRPRHGAFYRRLSFSKPLSDERTYPGVEFPVQLFASDVKRDGDRVLTRFPAFHSLPHERRMLFGDLDMWNSLPVGDFALYPSDNSETFRNNNHRLISSHVAPNRFLTVLPTASRATKDLRKAA
ncbi:hypothetical protein ACFQ14_12815 [Pseudahrensia aquimaris]|uniref:N-acyl amino acid synthase FeeM catalytic core domain-containing protein n=1 Tax=Pseudahrensia aquimaris TaxID=744461 RepID=A0ABW3FKP0_9HYPH